jgi:hypothetical protein
LQDRTHTSLRPSGAAACSSHSLLALDLRDLAHGRVDDADGDRHAHVTHGEAAQRGVRLERLDDEGAHGLEHDVARIAGLDVLGVLLDNLVRAAVNLVLDLLIGGEGGAE